MGLTENASFSQSGEAGNFRNIVRFHNGTAKKANVKEDILYHVGRIVCQVNYFVPLNLTALQSNAVQDLPLFGFPNFI